MKKGNLFPGWRTARKNRTLLSSIPAPNGPGSDPFKTAGGRVLAVTGWGETLQIARDHAYAALKKITFEGAHHRTDIASRGLLATVSSFVRVKKGLRHLNSGISAILALSVLGTQCLFAYQPEKDFWTERRKAMRRTSSTLLASRPLDAGSGRGNSLTAQFPTPQSVGAVLSPSLARSVPACFSKDAAKILAALSPATAPSGKYPFQKTLSATVPWSSTFKTCT
jgi:hypothetical protein